MVTQKLGLGERLLKAHETIYAAIATKPVLYTAGSEDPQFPPEIFEAITGSIGGPVQKKLFQDTGHQLMLFATEEFSKAVHEFYTETIS